MSYSIYIGQRHPHRCEDGCCEDGYQSPDEVDEITLTEAPADPFSPMSDHKNGRHPGYAQWHDFAKRVGLCDVLGHSGTPLLPEHPGIATLTEEHQSLIEQAEYEASRAGADQADMACLRWLNWWMRWALDHCEWPSIYNR